MNTSTPESIVIVGGGASATLLIAQLSIQLNADASHPVVIYVIDDNHANNGGTAYQVANPSFLLNVTANQMGAYHDKPDDFYQWIKAYPQLWRCLHTDFSFIEYQPNDFVPRMIYGAYLVWIFDEAINLAQSKNISIHKISAQVTHVKAIDDKLLVSTHNHSSLIADTLVFATGNRIQKHQDLTSPHIFSSPYCQTFLQQDWSAVKNIIIVGSGLSMIDAVQHLEQQNYSGSIQVFSRHGLLPLPHSTEQNSRESPPFSLKNLNNARQIVQKLRKQIAINNKQGINWQKTINSFRAQVATLWLSLTTSEQEKLKRFLPWWNIARHRIPVHIHEKVCALKKAGRLIITKGDVKKAHADGEYFLLNLNHKTLLIKSEKLVICSGYNGSYDNLIDICGDLVQPVERLKKHFNCNQLKVSKDYSIYALGPTLKDIIFETTAIHEIRQQSNIIASGIRLKKEFPLSQEKKYLHV